MGEQSFASRRGYLAFVALSLIVFAPALGIGFRDDDFAFLAHARRFGASTGLLAPSDTLAFHRPGAAALFYLEYLLFGLRPGAYLAFNYALHLGVSLALRSLFLAQGAPRRLADTAAGLFLVGYLHYGKQVMWACTSGPLLSVLLTVLALRAVLVIEGEAGPWPRRLAWAAVVAAFGAGPVLHESSLIAPLLLLVLARRRRTRVMLTALAAVAGIAWAVPHLVPAQARAAYHLAWARVANAPFYLVRYVGFMLVPFQPRAAAEPGTVLRAASIAAQAAVGAGALAALFIRGRRSGESVRFAGVWLPLALLPFSLLALPEGWLDLRYVYSAAPPLALAVAAALLALPRVVGRSLLAALVAASALLVVGLGLKYRADARSPRNAKRLQNLQARVQEKAPAIPVGTAGASLVHMVRPISAAGGPGSTVPTRL